MLRAAEFAVTTGAAQPGYAHALTRRPFPGGIRLHRADNLVTGNERQGGLIQLAIHDVQIGAADPACADPDQDLAPSGFRPGNRLVLQGGFRSMKNHGIHGLRHLLSRRKPRFIHPSPKRIMSP